MSASPELALGAYGLTGALLESLSGGTLNGVWRLETLDGAFVLKRYDFVDIAQVRKSIEVQQAALVHGVSVPHVVLNAREETVTVVDGRAFVLSEYVAGRLYEPGRVPAAAARKMGVELARLHDALLSLAPDVSPRPFPSLQAIEADLRGLLAIARSRRDNPVDAVAEGVLEAKLDLLSTIGSVPAVTSQWTHGDYEWRNVLFDEQDEVAAVIDFDNAIYYPSERDVMRCIALTFPSLEPEVDFFFGGYAVERKVSPREAASYVELYQYFSTFRVWPISERYLRPDRYKPGWDALIQPFFAWDWDALSDRLAAIAEAR